MTKDVLLEILTLSENKDIPEKDAAFEIIGKRMNLNHYKKKYGIPVYAPGKSKHSRGKRKHNINDDYFSVYTLENCYYAGFIAADGNINKRKSTLTISLSLKDKDFLTKFLENIESNYQVHTGATREIFTYASIGVLSKKICNDLETKFNITPQKSLTLVPPHIEDKALLDAFITGLLDGDGTISFVKKKLKGGDYSERMFVSLIGTKEMVEMVKQRFEEILGHKVSNLHHEKQYSDNTYTIRISDSNARKIFLHYYGIDVPKLERKWGKEKYEYCVNFKKKLPLCKRKGINIFNLDGDLLEHFDTLEDASEYTGLSCGRLSDLCKKDDSEHMSNGFMCSRTKEQMNPYNPTNPFSKALLKKYKGEENIEDLA